MKLVPLVIVLMAVFVLVATGFLVYQAYYVLEPPCKAKGGVLISGVCVKEVK